MSNSVKQVKIDIAERTIAKLSRDFNAVCSAFTNLKKNLTAENATNFMMCIDQVSLDCVDLKDDARALVPPKRKAPQKKAMPVAIENAVNAKQYGDNE